MGEPAKDEMKDLDGKWNRFVTLDTITVSGLTDWLVSGPHRVLEMRDPNSDQGWEEKTKPHHQYVLTRLGIFSRCLPPESVGDTWRDEQQVRPFTWRDGGEDIVGLLAPRQSR